MNTFFLTLTVLFISLQRAFSAFKVQTSFRFVLKPPPFTPSRAIPETHSLFHQPNQFERHSSSMILWKSMIPILLVVAVHGVELGERQAVSVEEAATALDGSQPSTGDCFPVFVQTTGAGTPFAVDAPVTGNLRDLVKEAQSQSLIPKFRSDEGVTVTVARVPFTGPALLTSFAEAGVAAESVVEINVSKSDIQ